jgi:hypothetical protein
LTPTASGRERLRGLPQSVRQAFSPALVVVEQGSALSMRHWRVSALLPVLKVFGLIRLHAFYNIGMGQGLDAVQLPGYTGCDRTGRLRSTDPPPGAR